MSPYLSGKTTPRSEILNFLATTLGVETEWLKGTDVSVDTLKKETNEAGIQMENMKFDYNYNNMKENDRDTLGSFFNCAYCIIAFLAKNKPFAGEYPSHSVNCCLIS